MFIGGKLVGGADEMEALVASGELGDVLETADGVDPLPELLRTTLQAALAQESTGAPNATTDAPAEGIRPPLQQPHAHSSGARRPGTRAPSKRTRNGAGALPSHKRETDREPPIQYARRLSGAVTSAE